MKLLGGLIIVMAIVKDLPYDIKERAAVWAAARLPQYWTTVKQLEEYLKKQAGRRR